MNWVCSLLKPQALKEKIESDLALDKHELRKLWGPFYRHVISEAVSCDKYVPVKKPLAKSRTRDREKTMDKNRMTVKHKLSGVSGRATTVMPWSKETAKKNQEPHKPNGMGLTLCLNTDKCRKRHKMKDCDISTEAEKASCLKKYYDEKANNRLSLMAMTSAAPNPLSAGRFDGKLADTVPVVVNGDYGADHSAFSETHLRICGEANVFI